MDGSLNNSSKDGPSTIASGGGGGKEEASAMTTVASTTEGSGGAVPRAEVRSALTKRRIEYAMGMMGRHAKLASLRKSRRLPLTEAAYNGHHEVLQVGFDTRLQMSYSSWGLTFLCVCLCLRLLFCCPPCIREYLTGLYTLKGSSPCGHPPSF